MHIRSYHLSFADKLETQVSRACVQKDLRAKSVKYLKMKLWLVSVIIHGRLEVQFVLTRTECDVIRRTHSFRVVSCVGQICTLYFPNFFLLWHEQKTLRIGPADFVRSNDLASRKYSMGQVFRWAWPADPVHINNFFHGFRSQHPCAGWAGQFTITHYIIRLWTWFDARNFPRNGFVFTNNNDRIQRIELDLIWEWSKIIQTDWLTTSSSGISFMKDSESPCSQRRKRNCAHGTQIHRPFRSEIFAFLIKHILNRKSKNKIHPRIDLSLFVSLKRTHGIHLQVPFMLFFPHKSSTAAASPSPSS